MDVANLTQREERHNSKRRLAASHGKERMGFSATGDVFIGVNKMMWSDWKTRSWCAKLKALRGQRKHTEKMMKNSPLLLAAVVAGLVSGVRAQGFSPALEFASGLAR